MSISDPKLANFFVGARKNYVLCGNYWLNNIFKTQINKE